MTVYEKIAQAMADENTDYVSILLDDNGIELYTSLEYEDLTNLLTEILMQQKEVSTIH